MDAKDTPQEVKVIDNTDQFVHPELYVNTGFIETVAKDDEFGKSHRTTINCNARNNLIFKEDHTERDFFIPDSKRMYEDRFRLADNINASLRRDIQSEIKLYTET